MIAEYNTAGNVLRRYIHGPGLDEPLVWLEGAGHSDSGTPDRRHLYADERGSVVASEGSLVAVNTYGPFGEPGSSNTGRFQYTGQMWLPEAGLYHYKARAYSPELGRFMQPDPIGYGDGMNLYAYVGNDPMNFRDPTGTEKWCHWVYDEDRNNRGYEEEEGRVVVTAKRYMRQECYDVPDGDVILDFLVMQFPGLAPPTWPVPGHCSINRRGGKTGEGTFGMVRNQGTKMHSGIDIAAPIGTEAVSAFTGRVTKVDDVGRASSGGYGRQVVIQVTGTNNYIQYAHLASVSVAVGEFVRAGEVIGATGVSGNTPKGAIPHLHFEARRGGDTKADAVDPTMNILPFCRQ